MAKYIHKFEVRWSDIDANRHLANASYVQYCAHARMGFLKKQKLGLSQLNRYAIGPVILHERYSFFREIYSDRTVYVTVELSGASEDGMIYRFLHKFYLPDGSHCATAEATGVWIDTNLRKMTTPPEEVLSLIEPYKTADVETLTRESLKDLPFKPEDVSAADLVS